MLAIPQPESGLEREDLSINLAETPDTKLQFSTRYCFINRSNFLRAIVNSTSPRESLIRSNKTP